MPEFPPNTFYKSSAGQWSLAVLIVFGLFFLLPLKTFPVNNDSLWNVWNDENQADSVRLKSLKRIIWGKFMNITNDSLYMLGNQMLDLAKSSGNKQMEADACWFIGASYGRRFNDSAETMEFFNRSLQLNIQIGNKRKIAKDYKFMGLACMHNFKYAQARDYYQKCLEIYEEIGYDKGVSDYYLYTGLLLLQLGDFNKARVCFGKSLEILEKTGIKNNSKEWAYSMGNIGTVLAKQGSYGEALAIFNQTTKIYKETDDMLNLASNFIDIGLVYKFQGNYIEAINFYYKSLIIWEKLGVKLGIANLYIQIGNVYIEQGKYSKALDLYEQSLVISEYLKEKSLIAEGYERIGLVYYELGNFSKSIRYYNQSLEIFEEIGLTDKVSDLYSYIGKVYHRQEYHDQSLEYFQKSLKINQEVGRKNAMADNYTNLGDHYKSIDRYQKAFDFYKQGRNIREEIGDKRGMAEIYICIGDLNIIQNNIIQGINWCKKGYDIAAEIGVLKLEKEASFCLYKAYKKLGKSTLALKYYENNLALQDSLKTDEASKQLQQMEFERQRLADSLAVADDKLETELVHQETLLKEKNTRNTFMFVGLGILLIAGALFSRMLFVRKTNKKLEEKNRIIAKEKERAEESEKAKEQFFDNVSHEFRTPLTLILGPLEAIMESTTDENKKAGLQIVQRNALRLQGMINEILELSKLEFGKIKLQAKEENIVKLTEDYLQNFESLADRQKIKLSFHSDIKDCKIWIDVEKFRKILANLLSNAFKFTEGGEIKVSIEKFDTPRTPPLSKGAGGVQPTWIEITISDTGIGIPKDKLSHIFDRFYQVDEPAQAHHAGTGIGLALTKELVELHHGTISVKSKPGKGTSFMIVFPLGYEHLQEDEIVSKEIEPENTTTELGLPVVEKEISGLVSEDVKKKKDLPILLITEDNPDMRSYIKTHLVKEYNIIEAGNGEEGLQKAIEQIPDLIISDVMMPKMDGYEMTEKIKTDQRTSHIPVIILTARASVESRIEGLETGADAYVTKPFHARELKVRVKKLIGQRQKLRDTFARNLNAGVPVLKNSNLSSMEQKFIEKAIKVISVHLSDTDFDASVFASGMALSRAQLHRKIKALTNKATTEFIRTIRLNRAAELLKHKTDSVTQIAYETGFTSLSWFSRMFREQFGVSPSEYMG